MWHNIGNEWAVGLLQRAIETNRVVHTYLFSGPSDIGKTHLAMEMASALSCTGADRPCHACSACSRIAQGKHPDVTRVEPEDGRIRIETVRNLQRELSLSPYEGRWRVCILSDFQYATPEAANALLKTLEEPPSRVVLILTTTDTSLLLPTIVSRCQVLALRAVPVQRIERALIQQEHADPELARTVARLSDGRVGWAIGAVRDPKVLETRQQYLGELDEILSVGRADRILAAERLGKRSDLRDVLRLWQMWWRDILLVCSACDDLVLNIDRMDELRRQTEGLDTLRAQRAVQSTHLALQQIEKNVNPRLALEVLFLQGYRPASTH